MENFNQHFAKLLAIIGGGAFLSYFIIFFVLTLCGVGLPVPEDIVLIAAGLFVYQKKAGLIVMIIVSLAGVIIGDYLIFYFGRRWGIKFLNHRIFKDLFSEKRVQKVHRYFDKYGNKFIFFARFFWGLRAVTFFIAGTHTMSVFKFILLDLLGAIISIPIIIYVAYRFGGEIEKTFALVKQTHHAILAVVIISIIGLVIKHYYYERKNK